jgi:hypothetical protein
MKIFVASWFFPPVTTAEAFVTFKLLKNSKHEYYVCYANSQKWSYHAQSEMKSDNIHTFPVDTDNLDVWVDACVKIFLENQTKINFDCVMTRIMPPESHVVGLRIRELVPEITWIASFNDPLALNPYELKRYAYDVLPKRIMSYIEKDPKKRVLLISRLLPTNGLKKMCANIKLEEAVLKQADFVIFPTFDQWFYTLKGNFKITPEKVIILPHSFDASFYTAIPQSSSDKFVFSYIGHADSVRNPMGFIQALKLIREINPTLLEQIELRLVGNIPSSIKDTVYAFQLQKVIRFIGPVSYQESLFYMKNSDCLLHVDAFFSFMGNGSIFFASKLVDFMGAKKMIFGLTTKDSAAGKILCKSENPVCLPQDINSIAKIIYGILNHKYKPDLQAYEAYNAIAVSQMFDRCLAEGKGNGILIYNTTGIDREKVK